MDRVWRYRRERQGESIGRNVRNDTVRVIPPISTGVVPLPDGRPLIQTLISRLVVFHTFTPVLNLPITPTVPTRHRENRRTPVEREFVTTSISYHDPFRGHRLKIICKLCRSPRARDIKRARRGIMSSYICNENGKILKQRDPLRSQQSIGK